MFPFLGEGWQNASHFWGASWLPTHLSFSEPQWPCILPMSWQRCLIPHWTHRHPLTPCIPWFPDLVNGTLLSTQRLRSSLSVLLNASLPTSKLSAGPASSVSESISGPNSSSTAPIPWDSIINLLIYVTSAHNRHNVILIYEASTPSLTGPLDSGLVHWPNGYCSPRLDSWP